MYPPVNVTDGYAAHSQNNHPPQGHVLQMASYSMPQQYVPPPPPYMTSTTSSRVIPRTNQWSKGLDDELELGEDGVLDGVFAFVGHMFNKCVAVLTASGQNSLGIPFSNNMELAISVTV
ncbi:hypothetical protein TSUD_95610 [Trifolium subterraneum]|uniref:Uncharacterized protein n=1 Tax=Trifolium subterraneum TaxID=3900 RepID=A0A2Z6LSN2_TRISU|nr:hypothetical protein TSUD_95610 [Trifolium subterraneum]